MDGVWTTCGAEWSLWTATRALARRPDLWPTALRQARRMVPPGWWRRAPFLPLPDASYLRFRLETAYGPGAGTRPSPGDIIGYLAWCRGMNRGRGRS